jgi:hypothetical protein
MAERFHSHSSHNEIFFCTGLQLETRASELASSGKHNIVKQYNEFHLADCKGLKREFDIMYFMEIEKNHHEIPYLTLSWSKHRYVNDTPADWKYTAYRFRPDFGILDDINGKDMSVSDIYADEADDSSEEISSHVVDIF